MLALTQLIGFGAGGEELKPALSYLGHGWSDIISGSTSGGVGGGSRPITFGAEDPTRRIIAVLTAQANTTVGVASTVTIGGVAASIIVQNTDSQADSGGVDAWGVCIAIANVPTGASGDVASDFNAVSWDVHLYRVTNLISATPTDTATDDDDAVSMTCDVLQDGIMIGAAVFESNLSGVTTTGLTEDADGVLASGNLTERQVVASASLMTAETGRTVTFDGATGDAAGAVASWR